MLGGITANGTCVFIDNSEQSLYLAKNYTFDQNTGKFSLVSPVFVNASTLSSEYNGYYAINFNTHSVNETINSENLDSIFKINSYVEERQTTTIGCTDTNGSHTVDGQLISLNYSTSSTSSVLTNIYDSGLFVTKDNNNNNIYYFRNEITNNYVKFANLTWRIVGINNDNSIKIILSDKLNNSSTFGPTSIYKDSIVKTTLENWYDANLKTLDNCINDNEYCNDTSNDGTTYYSISRLNNGTPTFDCQNNDIYSLSKKNITNKIGLITIDELIRSGLHVSESNPKYYLYDSSGNYKWTMTANTTNKIYTYNEQLNPLITDTDQAYLQPVINLKSNISVTGTGTYDDPYIPGELIQEQVIDSSTTTNEVSNPKTGEKLAIILIISILILLTPIIIVLNRKKIINKI